MASGRNNVEIPQAKLIRLATVFAIFLFIFLLLTKTTFITIPAGHKGVMFKRFSGGMQKDKVYNQGFQIIAPWNDLIVYDVRTKEGEEDMDVLSKNGLNIKVKLSFRYSPIQAKIGYLHDQIGIDYLSRIILPEIKSAVREVIGKYLPEELYSTKRETIQDEIFEQTKNAVGEKFILLDAVLIKSVVLPPTLRDAIEMKLKEEQMAFQYEFKLDRERKEAERKIIEAQAKADANKILSASLSANILKDKGIEATLELAKSENSKIVIVGGGKDGLPLIINN
ncbi:MAG: prohibitin family protein [Saprospiraceae bacterium]|nr:prohibitin family protein [Bacteroidia bacterium]NNE14258.1 prohibitin family protein [Saprospiraceae bacterium]NNL92498.1 prohibitin family protein [Saprospiraceae bacterium]